MSAAHIPARRQNPCSQCLGALAHRLSQPLTALHGSLELALLGPDDAARLRADLGHSLEIAQQAARMIAALRELSVALTPQASFKRIPFDNLVREAREEVRGLAASRGVGIELLSPRALAVWGDRDRVREIVLKIFFQILEGVPKKCQLRVRARGRQNIAFLSFCAPIVDIPACEIQSRRATAGELFAWATRANCLGWLILQSLAQSLGGDLLVRNRQGHELRVSLQLPRVD